MPEGTLCNKRPVASREELDALLADSNGRTYYAEMEKLEMDSCLLFPP